MLTALLCVGTLCLLAYHLESKEGQRGILGRHLALRRFSGLPVCVRDSSPAPVAVAPVNALVSHLLVVEPEKLYAMPDPASPDGHLPAVATLCDLFDREIVVTISWAKSIPGEGPGG